MHKTVNKPLKMKWYTGVLLIAGMLCAALLTALVRGTLYMLTQNNFLHLLTDLACIGGMAALLWKLMQSRLTTYAYSIGDGVLTLEALRGERMVKQLSINLCDIQDITDAPQGRAARYCCRDARQKVLCYKSPQGNAELWFAPDAEIISEIMAKAV